VKSNGGGRGSNGPDMTQAVAIARLGVGVIGGWKVALVVGVIALALLLVAGVFMAASGGATGGSGMTCVFRGENGDEIPANYVPWLEKATAKYKLGPRGFAIVAAIHKIESDFGRSPLPGVTSGENEAHAGGPGQFLPETWDGYGVDADGDGKRDRYSIPDSIFATANYLHASGAPKDWYTAIFAYNHADWYVRDVESTAAKFNGGVECRATEGTVGGNALLKNVEMLFQPRVFKPLPLRLWAGGAVPQSVDSRIWPDVVWLLGTYHLVATAAREAGHETHGDGTAVDLVPASGYGWDATALRAAQDLGWISLCGSSGVAPACPLVPAIHFIGYNGYPSHGDPLHAGGNAHLHVSWESSSYGSCPQTVCAPPVWVKVFPLAG
jgi:hypothetical protein